MLMLSCIFKRYPFRQSGSGSKDQVLISFGAGANESLCFVYLGRISILQETVI